MQDLVSGWPFWVVLLAFWAGAVARGSATYAIGRAARAGGARSRWSRHLERPAVRRAERWVGRIGPPAVTLGFLTVGLQSAVNASAGALRMPLRRFVPAVVLGGLLWAVLYTTVGLAVVDAWLGRLSWGWVLAAVGVLGVATIVGRRLTPPGVPDEVERRSASDPR
ncbi:VTT domain-containing protein [Phycicoccus sp. BSK3Z-2]|uniref:VTT domain-containing protein n=1 Tax=Phycicoccus avicenniae TaxID=2828860 RepID=A0A941DAI0_9MICO|nr:VTT domain-containing protein [Phycicoccus avicenniae]MBR7744541.1 VTT domain-containing protein [Phycicoccus avicenniae]